MNIKIQKDSKGMLKWLLLCLAFAFATGMRGASLRGDLDNDGEVSVNDVIIIVGHILGTEQGEPPAGADMDGDGDIGIKDVAMLVDLILEGERGPIGDGGEANPGYPALAPQR